MLMIKVWCLPTSHSGDTSELHQHLIRKSLEVEGLALENNKVVCLFPVDPNPHEIEEVIIELKFIDETKRSPESLASLQKEITQAVQAKFPEARIRCIADESEGGVRSTAH